MGARPSGSVGHPHARYDGRGLLGPGITAPYLGLIVLIPIAALLWRSISEGAGGFLGAVTSPQAMAALQLTFFVSLLVVVINARHGHAIAWVLVRDDFPGKSRHQRAHRPAVRAAHDRRRPHAADALRAPQPVRLQHRLHAGWASSSRSCS